MPTKITTIRLDNATLQEIEYLKNTLHLNTSSIIRLAISNMYAQQLLKESRLDMKNLINTNEV